MATTIKVSEELRDRVNRGAQERGVTAAGLVEALPEPADAMTEQPRTVRRDRFVGAAGRVDAGTMHEVDTWLRDFLSLA